MPRRSHLVLKESPDHLRPEAELLAIVLVTLGLSILILYSGCAWGGAEAGPAAETLGAGEPRAGIGGERILGKADGACGPFPDDYFEYLDDTRCQKRLPGNRDRDWACPNVATTAEATVLGSGERVVYRPAGAEVEVDADALVGWVPEALRITVILVRRVGGVPHYRYLSNGRHDEIVQPWSSTKFMAVANAAAALRRASGYRVGLTGEVLPPGGEPLALGDLVTVIHSYDERRFTSNGLSRWFHDVGTRRGANALVHEGWLGRSAAETFGGNYGAAAPDIGYALRDGEASLVLAPEQGFTLPNQLSTLTMAEFLKRLVMHREDAATRLPGLQWADLRVLFYGAEASRWYGAGTPQGMEADTAIYLQQALDTDALEARSGGQWRIFSKLGYGGARGGELVHNAYACLPTLDAEGAPVPDVGKELVVSLHLSAQDDHRGADQRLAEIYRELLWNIQAGRIK